MKINQVTFEIELDKGEDFNEMHVKILDGMYDDVTTYLDSTFAGFRLRLEFQDGDDVTEILAETVKHLSKLVT